MVEHERPHKVGKLSFSASALQKWHYSELNLSVLCEKEISIAEFIIFLCVGWLEIPPKNDCCACQKTFRHDMNKFDIECEYFGLLFPLAAMLPMCPFRLSSIGQPHCFQATDKS